MLFFYVEGETDILFFKEIIEPYLKQIKVKIISLHKANQNKKQKLNEKISALIDLDNKKKMQILIVVDSDANNYVRWNAEAKEKRFKRLVKEFGLQKISEKDLKQRVFFIVIEIESWFLAGLDQKSRRILKIKKSKITTDDCSKEDFNRYIGKIPKIEDLKNLLEYFQIDVARDNNKSFNEFIKLLDKKKEHFLA